MKQSKLQRLLLPGPRGKKWNENRPSIGSKFETPVSFLILLRFFLPLPLQRMRVQHFAPWLIQLESQQRAWWCRDATTTAAATTTTMLLPPRHLLAQELGPEEAKEMRSSDVDSSRFIVTFWSFCQPLQHAPRIMPITIWLSRHVDCRFGAKKSGGDNSSTREPEIRFHFVFGFALGKYCDSLWKVSQKNQKASLLAKWLFDAVRCYLPCHHHGWPLKQAKYLMYRNDSKCDNRYPGFRSNIQPYTAWHFNTFHSERSSAPAFPCRTFAPPPHTSAMPRWTFSPDWLRVDLSRAGNVRVCWEPQADLAFKCFQQLSLFISAWNTSIVVKFEASAPCNSKHFLKSCEILGFVSQIVASQRTSVAPSALMT